MNRQRRLYKAPAHFGSNPNKNVVDGDYLWKYNSVPTTDRMKWARTKGTSEDRVLDDMLELECTADYF